jgi:uncharacterized protein (TIGR02453 family)
MAPPPRFTPRTIPFLRALKRHNDRDWFRERRDEYDTHVRGPMVDVIDRLAEDLRGFAPELVAAPKTSLFRIYRDTRFSEDKSPLKTHAAAVFPHRELGRLEGAVLYLEVAPTRVMFAGGLHAPASPELRLIRAHVARRYRRLRGIIGAAAFGRTFGSLDGRVMQRVPHGYAKDHPAADLLRRREFLASKEYPAAFAADPKFYRELLRVFRQIAPLVSFLNEPLVGRVKDPLRP